MVETGRFRIIKEPFVKLYYMPAACSLAPHITLRELGITADLVRVDTAEPAVHNREGSVPCARDSFRQIEPLLKCSHRNLMVHHHVLESL